MEARDLNRRLSWLPVSAQTLLMFITFFRTCKKNWSTNRWLPDMSFLENCFSPILWAGTRRRLPLILMTAASKSLQAFSLHRVDVSRKWVWLGWILISMKLFFSPSQIDYCSRKSASPTGARSCQCRTSKYPGFQRSRPPHRQATGYHRIAIMEIPKPRSNTSPKWGCHQDSAPLANPFTMVSLAIMYSVPNRCRKMAGWASLRGTSRPSAKDCKGWLRMPTVERFSLPTMKHLTRFPKEVWRRSWVPMMDPEFSACILLTNEFQPKMSGFLTLKTKSR